MKPISIALLGLLFCSLLLYGQDGRIVYLEGTVSIGRGDSLLAADFGSGLLQGDSVSTGRDSVAVIRTDRGGEIKLRENTVLRLDKLQQETRVHLTKGGIFSKITRLIGRSYTVTTPSVAAGVRGTEFFIAYGRTIEENPDVWLCVNEGSVAVVAHSGDKVLVTEGEGVNILSGSRITEPRFFPWTKNLNWNTDPQAGAIRDTTDLEAAYSDLLDIDYD
jgi:ferric-dicitrate binding protein FerR (iron transport regulator)